VRIELSYVTTSTLWTNAINQSLTNHLRAVTNLYAKGARTLSCPRRDLTQIPYYANTPRQQAFRAPAGDGFQHRFRQRIKADGGVPSGLKVYVPDLFTLLDNINRRPAEWGFTNALSMDRSWTRCKIPRSGTSR